MNEMKVEEIRQRTDEELTTLARQLAEDLYTLRVQRATNQLENTSSLRIKRRDLADQPRLLGHAKRLACLDHANLLIVLVDETNGRQTNPVVDTGLADRRAARISDEPACDGKTPTRSIMPGAQQAGPSRPPRTRRMQTRMSMSHEHMPNRRASLNPATRAPRLFSVRRG